MDAHVFALSGPQVFSLLLLSNLLALLAWFVFSMGLLGWQELSLMLMVTIYIGIYLAEKLLFSHQAKGLDDRPYMNLRVRLTAAVIVFHGLALIFLTDHNFYLLTV